MHKIKVISLEKNLSTGITNFKESFLTLFNIIDIFYSKNFVSKDKPKCVFLATQKDFARRRNQG